MARPTLKTHRKFLRLERALGSAIVARGVLELLWDACYESGEDYVGTSADIEHLVGWTGEPGALARALVEAGAPEGHGFLEPTAEGASTFRVHDLWHHAPDYVSNRRTREDERRVEKTCKQCGRPYSSADPRSEYCSGACRTGGWRDRRSGADRRVTDGDGQTSASPRSVTDRDEQRRLPGVTVTDRDSTRAPAPAPAHQKKSVSTETSSVPAQPAILEFPVTGPGSGTWPLTADKVAEWAALFPTLDVLAECRKALAWVRENPRNRKTASGMGRFLVGWFTRTIDRGGARLVGRQDGPHDQRPRGCRHQPACRDAVTCTAKSAAERKAIPA